MSNREKPSKVDSNIQQPSMAINDENVADIEDKSAKPVTPIKSTTPIEKEINGPKGLEPTRYGDWESKGRCYDF